VLVSDATEIILKREYHPRYNFILGEAYQWEKRVYQILLGASLIRQ
jgi:hypothetical protein